jgi:hypothetical protein
VLLMSREEVLFEFVLIYSQEALVNFLDKWDISSFVGTQILCSSRSLLPLEPESRIRYS